MLDWFLVPLQPWPAQPWLAMSPLEIAATTFGLWSVIAYVRESLWAWPAGLVNVLLYIALFWQARLYGDATLQVFYVALQVYGWWQWLHLLCDIDIPWVADGQRDMPHRRAEFAQRCQDALAAHGRPVVRLSGDHATRLATAVVAIDRLLGPLAGAQPVAAQERLAAELAAGGVP